MQKLIFTCALALLAVASTTAQISITSSSAPSAGLVITTRTVDSVWLANQNFGMPGANRTWNFANPVYNGPASESVRYVAASGTPNFAKFPTATLAGVVADDDGAVYNYYQATPTQFSVLGSVAGSEVTTFSPALAAIQFPTNYQSNYNASANVSITGGDLAGAGTVTDSVTADAWGSITTPLGTFQCLRVIDRQTIRINLGGIVPAVIRNVTTNWFTTQYRFPVFSYTLGTTSIQALGLNFRTLDGEMLVSATTGVNDPGLAASIQISPNPASDRALLAIQSEQQLRVDVQVYSQTGQLVKTIPNVLLSVGDNQIELPVDDVATGNYTLLLMGNNRLVGLQRLAVQH